MFDKKAINQIDIDEYETGLQAIAKAKSDFESDFGVNFAEYIPLWSPDLNVNVDQIHKAEFFSLGKRPKLDRSFVAQKKLEVYRQ